MKDRPDFHRGGNLALKAVGIGEGVKDITLGPILLLSSL